MLNKDQLNCNDKWWQNEAIKSKNNVLINSCH